MLKCAFCYYFYLLNVMIEFQEHYRIQFSHFKIGKYTRRDGRKLAGLRYLEISGFADKTRKLSVNYPTLAANRDFRRVPENPNDELNLLSLYTRLKDAAGPDQKYIYCRLAGNKRREDFRKQGYPNALTDPDL